MAQKSTNKIKVSFNTDLSEQDLSKEYRTSTTALKTLTRLKLQGRPALKYPTPIILSNNEFTIPMKAKRGKNLTTLLETLPSAVYKKRKLILNMHINEYHHYYKL